MPEALCYSPETITILLIGYTPVKVKVKVVQLCPTLCDSMSQRLCTVHGIFQARILEWVAFPFSRGHPNLVNTPTEKFKNKKNTCPKK